MSDQEHMADSATSQTTQRPSSGRHRDLLERLKAAKGPDRGIDWQIAVEIDGWAAHFDTEDFARIGAGLAGHGLPPDTWLLSDGPFKCSCFTSTDFAEPDEYTSAIDAALALVERARPGCYPDICRQYQRPDHPEDAAWWACVGVVPSDGVYCEGAGATAPLAILIALLEALSMGGDLADQDAASERSGMNPTPPKEPT